MTKDELVRWLKNTKYLAVNKAGNDYLKKEKALLQQYLELLGVPEIVEDLLPLFQKIFQKYDDFLSSFDSDSDNFKYVSMTKFCYPFGWTEFQKISTREGLTKHFENVIRFGHDSEYRKRCRELQRERDNVASTYDTVIQTVKNLPSAKDGLEYLKKLGFNVSEIESVKKQKQLPATISVNVDTRYLLLHKEKEDDRTTEINNTN